MYMADIKPVEKRMKKVPFDVRKFRHNETEVVTRGGDKVTILTVTYPREEYPIVGVINYANGGTDAGMWREDGAYDEEEYHDLFLLEPVKEKVKVERWVNIYEK